MSSKYVPPSINENAFSCPHCEAFTTQYWYQLHSKQFSNDAKRPSISNLVSRETIENNDEMEAATKEKIVKYIDNINSRFVFFESQDTAYNAYSVENLYLSKCYHCNEISVWLHDSLLLPTKKEGVMPNEDLPKDVKSDFEEARSILNLSPKGSAALLRLAIQKLCIHLGEKGKSIDGAIASLVSKGLNPMVQQSLDIVRVIGNESVHPGEIDLNDNREVAEKLFGLVNIISEQMISAPKHVQGLYESVVPERKRAAIDKRNKKATKES